MMLVGVKRAILMHPKHYEQMYPYPLYHPSDRCSLVDIHRPDYRRFPRFKELIGQGMIADAHPGEVLYIPGNWWHQIENFGQTTTAVTMFEGGHGAKASTVVPAAEGTEGLLKKRRFQFDAGMRLWEATGENAAQIAHLLFRLAAIAGDSGSEGESRGAGEEGGTVDALDDGEEQLLEELRQTAIETGVASDGDGADQYLRHLALNSFRHVIPSLATEEEIAAAAKASPDGGGSSGEGDGGEPATAPLVDTISVDARKGGSGGSGDRSSDCAGSRSRSSDGDARPIGEWLSDANPALSVYAPAFEAYGFENLGLLRTASEDELAEAMDELRVKRPHRRLIGKALLRAGTSGGSCAG